MQGFHARVVYCFAVVMVLGVVAGGRSLAQEKAQESKERRTPNFEGKVVLLRVDRSTSVESKTELVVLKSPEIVMLGGRYFIHGNPHIRPDEESEQWFAAGEIGYAWETVKEYWVFTPEAYDKYEKLRKERMDAASEE
jgi:hypothetical protein